MLKYLLLVFSGVTLQLTLANIEQDLHKLNLTGINELPSDIASKIPSVEDVEKAFAEKCRKNGGEKAFERAQGAKQKTVECIKGLINFDELQHEVEEAKPIGDLDTVFRKYCRKSPEIRGCISNFTNAYQPCFEENEKGSVATVLNVTDQLAEFICYKEGDRIALFIAEGGPECLNASKDAIRGCVESVFKKNFPNPDDITVNDIPLLLFKADQCEDFFKLQTCVVRHLEKCKEPTPANIVDSLFNFVRKVTPCSSFKFVEESKITPLANTSSRSNSVTLVAFVLLTFITGFFSIH